MHEHKAQHGGRDLVAIKAFPFEIKPAKPGKEKEKQDESGDAVEPAVPLNAPLGRGNRSDRSFGERHGAGV